MGLSTAKLLKIGEIAHRSGLPVKTIRYYEEIGLLTTTVERSQTGYRLFNDRVLNRLSFIKRAQALGLTLNEIKTILTVHDNGEPPCHEVKQHLQDKVTLISQQIHALETLQAELQGILSGWQEDPPAPLMAQSICPNIQRSPDRFRNLIP